MVKLMDKQYKEAVEEAQAALKDIDERGAAAIGADWDDVEKELFTPEEIAASDLRVALISEIIKARNEKGISQRQLGELSGVKQPVIARIEQGGTNPKLDTIVKLLSPLGMKLSITPV